MNKLITYAAVLMLPFFSAVAAFAGNATFRDGDNTFVYNPYDGYYRMTVEAEDADGNCLETRSNNTSGENGDLSVPDFVNVYGANESKGSWPWNYDRYRASNCKVEYASSEDNRAVKWTGGPIVYIQSIYMFTAIAQAVLNETDLSVTVDHNGTSATYDFEIDSTARGNFCLGGYNEGYGWFDNRVRNACEPVTPVYADPPESDADVGDDILNIISSRKSRRARMREVYVKLWEADQDGTLVATASGVFSDNGFSYEDGVQSVNGNHSQVSTFLGEMRCAIDVDNDTGHCPPPVVGLFGADQSIADNIVAVINQSGKSRRARFISVYNQLQGANQTGLLVATAIVSYAAQGITYATMTGNSGSHSQISSFLGDIRCDIDVNNTSGHCG